MCRNRHNVGKVISYLRPIWRGMAMLLALTIFLHATHLGELGKTPALLSHYKEHRLTHPDDTVLDFLYKHYIQDHKAESEQEQNSDNQLPFKAHTFHFDLSVFDLSARSIQPVLNALFEPALFPSTESALLSRAGENWHPPKIG